MYVLGNHVGGGVPLGDALDHWHEAHPDDRIDISEIKEFLAERKRRIAEQGEEHYAVIMERLRDDFSVPRVSEPKPVVTAKKVRAKKPAKKWKER